MLMDDKDYQFVQEAVFAIADGYCNINITKNIIPGVMHQVVNGVHYNLNEQLKMKPDSAFDEMVLKWGETIPDEGKKEFFEFFNRERLIQCFYKGQRHLSFQYWTRTATYEPMLAEDHLALFQDRITGDILGVNYVLDRTEHYRSEKYKLKLEENNRQLKKLIDEERQYYDILGALSLLYWQLYYIDLEKNQYIEVATKSHFKMDISKPKTLNHDDFLCFVDKFVVKDDLEMVKEFIDFSTLAERLKDKDSLSIECLTMGKFWVSLTFIVQRRNQIGKVTQVLYAVSNIDEHKKQELEYQKLLEKNAKAALKANEAKSEFLRHMSHDVRTPLNGVIGMLNILKSNLDDKEKVEKCLNKSLDATLQLQLIIEEVLDMNKLESKEVSLEKYPFNLKYLIKDCVNGTVGYGEPYGIQVLGEVDQNVIHHDLIGPLPLIGRVLSNLGTNAIKYNKKGGTVKISCQEISSDNHIAFIQFIVEDNGKGMSPSFLTKAFEPYEREGIPSLTTFSGTGLGLHIVKKSVEALNGTIEVESKVNKGSKFVVTIPLEIDQGGQYAKQNQFLTESFDYSNKTALLVDDNKLNLEIAQTMLESIGFHVLVATNGQEAVNVFTSSSPYSIDVILMDVMMPLMDGLTATKAIRSLQRKDGKDVFIIGLSANAFKDDIEKSIQAGMNDYLTKPLNINKMKQMLYRYLSKDDSFSNK